MKYFGSNIKFVHERNADIMRAYRSKMREAAVIRPPEIFRQVAESPASRFWVSEERAAIVISAMESGKPLPANMIPTKREMFTEIFRRYRLLRAQKPQSTIIELVTIVVHQPAPKFYFTPRTIGEFIFRIRNGYYDSK